LPSITQVIQSRIMKWTVGCGMWHLWERGKAYTRFGGETWGRGIDEMMLKWNLKRSVVWFWTALIRRR
jgi:hypothetical protein